MMRTVAVALLFIATSAPVFAVDAAQVQKCLNLTAEQLKLDASVELAMTTRDGTITSLEVTGYTPDNEAGYGVARAAYRAAMMCAPYAAESGTFAVTIAGENIKPDNIPLPGKQ